MDAKGGAPHRLRNDNGDFRNPTWSRNGEWLYYASIQQGEWQLWKQSADGGKAQQVTQDGGYFGMESLDGKTLFFTIYCKNGLWQMPTNGGKATLLIPHLQASQWGNWTLGADSLFFVDNQSTPPLLKRFDLDSGTASEVLTLPASMLDHYPGLSLSPDGQWLLFASADRVESDLVLVSSSAKEDK
jgi:Tol biopolymer transport system component